MDAQLDQQPNTIRLVEVYRCNTAIEAHSTVAYLANHGIEAIIEGEIIQSAMPLPDAVKIVVRQELASTAIDMLRASGRIPYDDKDNNNWHGPHPIARKSSLATQLGILSLIILLLLGAIAIYTFVLNK